MAVTDYIAQMVSDDICWPERLQKQFEFIKIQPNGDFFICYAREISEDHKFITCNPYNPDRYFHSITFSCLIYHTTMVYKKDAVLSVGKYTVPYAEDTELSW